MYCYNVQIAIAFPTVIVKGYVHVYLIECEQSFLTTYRIVGNIGKKWWKSKTWHVGLIKFDGIKIWWQINHTHQCIWRVQILQFFKKPHIWQYLYAAKISCYSMQYNLLVNCCFLFSFNLFSNNLRVYLVKYTCCDSIQWLHGLAGVVPFSTHTWMTGLVLDLISSDKAWWHLHVSCLTAW